MTTTGLLRSFFFVFSLGALVACDSSDNNNAAIPETPAAGSPDDTPGTIVEIAQENGNFETLVTVLEAAGLDSTLADENGEFTVFAPTDDAFAALPEGTLDALLADTDLLTDILLYHVISDSVVGSETAVSLAGSTQVMANESIERPSTSNSFNATPNLQNPSLNLSAEVQTETRGSIIATKEGNEINPN